MSVAASIITNSELQREVEQELEWDPSVTPASVGVSTNDHTVTLSGTVHSYASHMAAVRAAKRVKGVHAIADDIVVEPIGTSGRTDHDIAENAEHAMKWNFQRRSAERAVEYIAGVRHVSNNIQLKHVTLTGSVSSWAQRERAKHTA